MKSKFLKLFVIILCFVSINTGCEKENWTEVDLSNFNCGANSNTVNTYTDVRGTISTIPDVSESPIFIRLESPDYEKSGEYILPCNLPQEYEREGLEIIFCGELKETIDYVDTANAISSAMVLAQTIVLNQLKINDE